jgi:hypothetical protein
LKERATLDMNTMSSFKCKFSSYSYSSVYELEYSLDHVIIMIYELVYSLYAMILTCSYPFFNVHMTCMNRGRIRVGVAIRCTFRFAHVLACQSIGLESREDMGSFLVHERGARVHGNLRI